MDVCYGSAVTIVRRSLPVVVIGWRPSAGCEDRVVDLDDAGLDRLRLVGDPVPDRIVADLARDGEIGAVNALLRDLVRNDQPMPVALPDAIERWLAESACLPAWIAAERLDQGARVFTEHGVLLSLILGTVSLTECYAARKGCQALIFTYRLAQTPYRRIAETAQFILTVMAPGALVEGGEGIRAIQKVRLMHAGIRTLIRATGRWSEQELGVPLCQEDLLGTLMIFSALPVRHLRTMGATVAAEDAQAYYDLWRIIGEMLGVRPDAIPPDVRDGEALADTLARRHYGPSREGVLLMRALLEFHAGQLPGEAFDGMVPAFIRLLVGDQIADWLEVPRTRWHWPLRHARSAVQVADALDRGAGQVADVVDRLARAFLTRQAFVLNGYERAGFDIPLSLRSAWGLTPVPALDRAAGAESTGTATG
jgi:hypothetical protein